GDACRLRECDGGRECVIANYVVDVGVAEAHSRRAMADERERVVIVSYIEPAGVSRAGVVVIAHEAGLILRNLVGNDLLDGLAPVAQTRVITDSRVGGIGLVKALKVIDLIGGLV